MDPAAGVFPSSECALCSLPQSILSLTSPPQQLARAVGGFSSPISFLDSPHLGAPIPTAPPILRPGVPAHGGTSISWPSAHSAVSPYVSGRLDFGYSERPATTLPVYETQPQPQRGVFASPSAAPRGAAGAPSPQGNDRYGPPTDSLFGMLSTPAAKQPTQPNTAATTIAAPPTESLSPMRRDHFFPQDVPQVRPAAAAQVPASDPSNQLASWVTVFGFSPANSSFVLRHFQDVGTVLQHRSSHGNWMHLQFASPLEAQVALSKNGKVLGGLLMVGVAPCTDKDVLNTSREAEPRVVRRAAYDPSRDPLATREIPQERNSLWSKAMEHVFGL